MESFIINKLEIPFSSNFKKIAISVSGGADSALLSYLLCNHITNSKLQNIEIHIINHTRCWKTKPWQKYDALKVFDYLQKTFGELTFFKHTNFIAPDLEYAVSGPTLVDEYKKLVSGDNIQIRAFSEYICYHNDIDAYYNAVTSNPKNVDFKGIPSRDIEPSDNNKHLRLMLHMQKYAIHPFRFLDKKHIYKQYVELGLYDLWNITRSCEGTFTDIDYTNYIPYQTVPVCHTCFWCKEREWSMSP